MGTRHLGWIPAAAAVGFGASWLLADRLWLPVDLYYGLYVGIVAAFLGLYVRRTGLDLGRWLSRRRLLAAVLAVLGGLVLAAGVLARPGTPRPADRPLAWDLIWRGLAYGTADGMLLLAFPWLVTWRALGAGAARWPRKLGAAALAWAAILLVTTAYHLGYGDFRSRKIVQPNIGSSIGAVPTLLSANPAASVVSHALLHVAAVVHSPRTDLYLPPHRAAGPAEGGAATRPGPDRPPARGGREGRPPTRSQPRR